MAGLWPLSLQQRIDPNGRPYAGAKAYFYEASTLTPLTVYKDYSLGSDHPNPVPADGFGMFPAVYLDEADEFYRCRVTTATGTVLFDITTLPVIGPSGGEGGGGEVAVDADALAKTGDVKWRLGTGTHSGWVRVNGRTIGNGSSGASERANDDTEALFTLLYGGFSDTLCPVSGGRGASAAADFAANKTITLPDARGRLLAALDDMGNSAAGRITSTTIVTGSDAITLGNSGGTQTHTLTTAQLASHTHTGTTASDGLHGHPFRTSTQDDGDADTTGGLMLNSANVANQSAFTGTPSSTNGEQIGGGGAHTHTFTSDATGGGSAHNNMPPFLLATLYVRL